MTDYEVLTAMKRFGGGFVQKLAELYKLADARNQDRIKGAWPEYWVEYEKLAARVAKNEKKRA